MSLPLKRKISTPILTSNYNSHAPHSSSPVNSQYSQNSNLSYTYANSKRITEPSQIPTIREEDSFKASAGTSTRLSIDLPKLFFLKSLQGKQAIQKKTIKITEISQETSDAIQSQGFANIDSQFQAQKRAQAGNQIVKFNPQKGVHRTSLKAFAANNNSRDTNQTLVTETSGEARSKNFYVESSEGAAKPTLQLKIRKVMEESSHKKGVNTKIVDIKNLVRRNLEHTLTKTRNQQPSQFQEIEEAENKIQKDLAKINVIKDEVGLVEKIKVYRRHRDIASHFDRSMSSHGLPGGVVRNNSFTKKLIQNGDSRDSRDRSLEQNSNLVKSYALDLKRNSEASLLNIGMTKENRSRLSKKGSQLPSTMLEKSQIDRNNSSASIFLVENKPQATTGVDPHNRANKREISLGFSVKTKDTKEKSFVNLQSLPTEEDKIGTIESLGVVGTLEDLDMKKKDQESKAFKKLESYFKVATKQDIERKSITREEEMEYRGMREITQQSIMKGLNSNPSLILKGLPQEAEEIHNKITHLVKRVGQYQTAKDRKSPEQEEDVVERYAEILDELNMQSIRDEYRKRMTHSENVDYELVDSMILRLEFFAKLSKPVRMKLLQKSHLVYYTAGSSLLKKEENTDQMYVILRGAVNVRALKIAPNGKKEHVTIAVLRDGQHFGEYTLLGAQKETDNRELKICTHMGTLDLETGEENAPTKEQAYKAMKKKGHTACLDHMIEEWALNDISGPPKGSNDRPRRTATIEVAESCDLLCITRSQFQAIFLDLIQKELDSKLKLLLCLSFFQKMDPFGLIPLASNLVSRVFTMGDVIVSAGQEVNRLYIISQGRCKVTYQSLRAADPEMSQKYLQKRNSIKKNPSEKKLGRGLIKSNSILNIETDARKVYDQETIEVKDGKVFYVENILCGTLVRGDIIGGRAIMSDKDITEFDRRNGRDMYFGPAKLSVIVESPMVEVFELDQDHAACVSDFLLNIMKNGLKRSKQFDDYEFEKEKKEYEDWAKFKEQELKMIVKSKAKIFDGEVKK